MPKQSKRRIGRKRKKCYSETQIVFTTNPVNNISIMDSSIVSIESNSSSISTTYMNRSQSTNVPSPTSNTDVQSLQSSLETQTTEPTLTTIGLEEPEIMCFSY